MSRPAPAGPRTPNPAPNPAHGSELAPETIRRRIDELGPWFHNLELGGFSTAPDHFLGDYPRFKWSGFEHAIDADLTGKSVLDVGCNAGFYCFEMKRRGARRVLGVDSDEGYLAQARFAARVLGLDVEFANVSVYELARLGEKFDWVLFLGVLYHLRYPLLALDLLRACVVRDRFVFQSMQRGSRATDSVEPDYPFSETTHFDSPGYPKLHFVEERYAGDPTNWWIPNHACAQAMLRSAGFRILCNPEPEVFVCGLDDAPPCDDVPHNAAPERAFLAAVQTRSGSASHSHGVPAERKEPDHG